MSERLPVHLDPIAQANRGRSVHGTVPVRAFRRLAEWLHSDAGELDVRLAFGRDESGRRQVTGRIQGALSLVCHRCMVPYELPIDLDLSLVLVESEAEAETLPDELDALVIDDARSMHTVDMIEDDLILALPLVPRCEHYRECTPAVELLDSESLEEGDGPRQQAFGDIGHDA